MSIVEESTKKTAVAEGTDELTNGSSSSQPEPRSQQPSCEVFLGRWILVDSEMSTSLVQMTSGEMIVTRTGEDEYTSVTSWKLRFCCLPCISIPGSNSNVTKVTGEDTFTMTNKQTNLIDGNVEYGKIEGNNKYKTVGKKGTNEIEYRGDRCYMKIVDARYSLYVKQEWKRVP